jgi:outer membrane lipoprotein LolB
VFGVLALLCLSACRTLPPAPAGAPWPERRAALQAVGGFAFSGRLAAATANEGFSAALDWQQRGADSDLKLRAPLGVGGAHLQYDGTNLRVTASDGALLDGEAAHAELVRLLGFEPPLGSLRYWLLGVPDPATNAAETLDGAQRLQHLQQQDWRVDYSDYVQAAGLWLPQRLAMQRGSLRLRLYVARWQLPATPTSPAPSPTVPSP